MAFESALELILHHEGGLVDNPADPGGLTNYGISQRSYPNENIKALTPQKAGEIYKRDFWDKCQCDKLPPAIALAVFDSAVNQGVGFAAKALQRAAGANPDGIIGPATIAAASKNVSQTLAKFQAARMVHYASLPTFKNFGNAWSRRLMETTISAAKLLA